MNRQLIRQLLGGKRHFRDETTHRTLNGDVRHELIEVTVPQSVSDDCSRVLVACVDVTDAKTYERQLEAHNRTLERLAGIISHDLQTPLSTAKMTTTVLRLKLEEADSDVPQSVADLEQIHRRMQEFTEYLPRLARESTNVKHTTECDLATLAEAAWDVVHTHSLSLVIDDTTTVEGDPSRLQQMFENLFQNVVDHGLKPIATDREPDSDRIDRHEIQTTTVNSNSTLDVDDVATTVHVGTFAGGFYVADDGPGLRTTSPEIFDYGMGTGTGSGFGLAIVRTIVEAHGFTITATESDDGGARFEIRTRRTDT